MNELEAASAPQREEAATEPDTPIAAAPSPALSATEVIAEAEGAQQDVDVLPEVEPSAEDPSRADEIPRVSEDSTDAQAEEVTPEQLLIDVAIEPDQDAEIARKLAILEAVVYVTDEPLSAEQIAKALGEPLIEVKLLLDKLVEEYNRPHHGLTVREVAGGFKITTKPEHHEAVRTFVRNLNPPLKLSLAALETLAVIAYKQPITAPEIMEIRGVQGAGVLKTLIDRKLITTAGRKNVVGKPILYKTTKEFLVQFGLRDLNELPSLKEFEDLRRMAFADAVDDTVPEADVVDGQPPTETNPDQAASEQREDRESQE